MLWDEVGDLRQPLLDDQITNGRTWDIQLAYALLDATMGTGEYVVSVYVIILY